MVYIGRRDVREGAGRHPVGTDGRNVGECLSKGKEVGLELISAGVICGCDDSDA